MIDLKTIDELTRKLSDLLPSELGQAPEGLEQQIRKLLTRTLECGNLVSREEFDAQRAVLLKTREKLEALQARLEAMTSG